MSEGTYCTWGLEENLGEWVLSSCFLGSNLQPMPYCKLKTKTPVKKNQTPWWPLWPGIHSPSISGGTDRRSLDLFFELMNMNSIDSEKSSRDCNNFFVWSDGECIISEVLNKIEEGYQSEGQTLSCKKMHGFDGPEAGESVGHGLGLQSILQNFPSLDRALFS